MPPETDSKSNWYAGKRHVSWFTSKDVTDMASQLRKERKDERDRLHAEEDTVDDAEEYAKEVDVESMPDDIDQGTVEDDGDDSKPTFNTWFTLNWNIEPTVQLDVCVPSCK